MPRTRKTVSAINNNNSTNERGGSGPSKNPIPSSIANNASTSSDSISITQQVQQGSERQEKVIQTQKNLVQQQTQVLQPASVLSSQHLRQQQDDLQQLQQKEQDLISFRKLQQEQQQRTHHELMQLRLQQSISLRDWILYDQRGRNWVAMCIAIGAMFGFLLGAVCLDSRRRQDLSDSIQSTSMYKICTGKVSFYNYILDDWIEYSLDSFSEWATRVGRELEEEEYANNPGHYRIFEVLREAIIRESGGFVHPDLGFLTPAPSGASRGIGMISNTYRSCRLNCAPGSAEEELSNKRYYSSHADGDQNLNQNDILAIIPIGFQMTRTVALNTLLPRLPNTTSKETATIHELDDAALLTLLLAHERGVGRFSRWMPYIATLPQEPMCGYSWSLRSSLLDSLKLYQREYRVDVSGWSDELYKASSYADRIAEALNHDYGAYITSPSGISTLDNIKWSLCQVASRATAGDIKYGSLRLIPLFDLINHDASAGGVYEFNSTKEVSRGDIVAELVHDMTQSSLQKMPFPGAIVVRSLRHGRRKPLREGQELMINYNVQHYSPLDWFVSMGFIPPERWSSWQKINPVLPRISERHSRRSSTAKKASNHQTDDEHDGSSYSSAPTEQLYQKKEAIIRQKLRSFDL